MKNRHSDEFYAKKYDQLKEFAWDKGIAFPYRNYREFVSTWNALREDGVKNVDKVMKYGLQYSTDYKTALAEYRALKQTGVEGIKFRDLKLMTTTEFAAAHETDILDMYREKRSQGLSGDQAGAFISLYWFGSE